MTRQIKGYKYSKTGKYLQVQMQYLHVSTSTCTDRPVCDTHFSPLESQHICSFDSGEELHYCIFEASNKLDKGAEYYALIVDRHIRKANDIGAHPHAET